MSAPIGRLQFRLTASTVDSFLPTDLTGLQCWVAANLITGLADGDAVTTWTDLSGNGNSPTQGTAARRPTYRTAIHNGLPVVRFDGTDDSLGASFTLAVPYTVFLVTIPRTLPANQYAIDGITQNTIGVQSLTTDLYAFGDAGFVRTGVLAVGAFFYYTLIANGASSATYFNGGTEITGTEGAATGGIRLGSAANDTVFGNFDIAEVIVYNTALSAANRASVESYISEKYNRTDARFAFLRSAELLLSKFTERRLPGGAL